MYSQGIGKNHKDRDRRTEAAELWCGDAVGRAMIRDGVHGEAVRQGNRRARGGHG